MSAGHAFRTAPNSRINRARDDLGTLGGAYSGYSEARSINAYGQVVGISGYPANQHPFLYAGGVMYDLNNLIPAGSRWGLREASAINDLGQIVANGYTGHKRHAFVLTPIYKALVQHPINADGTSVFSVSSGALPVKFTLTQYDAATCNLLPATISVIRRAGGTVGAVAVSTYSRPASNASQFRIDTAACQYVYDLEASSMGVGTYQVDISINGIFIGHAVFALR